VGTDVTHSPLSICKKVFNKWLSYYEIMLLRVSFLTLDDAREVVGFFEDRASITRRNLTVISIPDMYR
jgi:hypothetical protein